MSRLGLWHDDIRRPPAIEHRQIQEGLVEPIQGSGDGERERLREIAGRVENWFSIPDADFLRSVADNKGGIRWVWARTNELAIALLEHNDFDVISLDHDMGLHEENPDAEGADLRIGGADECGCAVARWMVENGRVPPRIEVHSMNYAGAKDIASVFTSYWKATEAGGIVGPVERTERGICWYLEGINGVEHTLSLKPYEPKVQV